VMIVTLARSGCRAAASLARLGGSLMSEAVSQGGAVALRDHGGDHVFLLVPCSFRSLVRSPTAVRRVPRRRFTCNGTGSVINEPGLSPRVSLQREDSEFVSAIGAAPARHATAMGRRAISSPGRGLVQDCAFAAVFPMLVTGIALLRAVQLINRIRRDPLVIGPNARHRALCDRTSRRACSCIRFRARGRARTLGAGKGRRSGS